MKRQVHDVTENIQNRRTGEVLSTRVFNIDSWTVAHKRTKSLHTPSVTRIVGWMDHISDGSKWPSEQRELQREQLLAEWQAVAARQEKNQKNCVDLQLVVFRPACPTNATFLLS